LGCFKLRLIAELQQFHAIATAGSLAVTRASVHCDAKQNPYLILSAVRGTRSYSVPTCQPIPKAHDSTLECKAGVSIGVRARDQTELRFMLENLK
jgi:hypothetical protein